MFSLILIAITIATLAALSVVAINYTPRWTPAAQLAHELAASGFARLDKSFEMASAAQPDELPPMPSADADGGLVARFQPYFGFMPKAPQGLAWSYGISPVAGAFQNMHYFCLSGTAVDEGTSNGLQRLTRTLGASQAVLAATCGAASGNLPNSYPAQLALTYYVQFVPEVQ